MNKQQAIEFIRGTLMSARDHVEFERAGNLDDLRQNCQSARAMLAKLAASIGDGNSGMPTEIDGDLAIIRQGLSDWSMAEAALEALWRL